MSQTTETTEPYKSSAEILSELFSSFNADPPLVDEKHPKKHKKSKKKHKHKDKKHKKKSKKHSHSHSSDSSDYDTSSSESNKHKHKSKKKSKNIQSTIEKLEKWDIDFDISNVKKEPENVLSLLNAIKQETTDVVKTENDTSNKLVDENCSVSVNPDLHENDNKNANETDKTNKIMIKNLKNSSAYNAALKEIEQKALEKATKFEEGELTESEDSADLEDSLTDIQVKSSESSSSKSDRKRKHSHRDKSRDSDKEKKPKTENSEATKRCKKHKEPPKHSHHKTHHRSRSKDRDRSKEKTASHSGGRRDRDYRHYDDYYSNSRSYSSNTAYDRDRDRDRYKYDRDKRSRSRSRSRSKDRFRSKVNNREQRDRKRRSSTPSSSIDKKKLLEIARKNAINMLKSGTLPEALTLGPQAQEKVIAAIKAGGKTIEELTDFCKNLSKKEELGELSSVSSNEDEDDSENEKVFHHPFQLKEKPSSIVMNIKNATPLPVKTSKEKSAELRMQFPVSSGQLHRKNEGEWIPVSPKKPDAVAAAVAAASLPPLAIMPPPPPPAVVALPKPVAAPMQPPAFVKASTIPATLSTVAAPVELETPENTIAALAEPQTDVDISTIVSQRLNAMRRLQENPNDVQALTQMYKVQKEMSAWAQSKQQPGQFTGSTGAQILTPAELSSGYQAWARKDQLQNAAPVTGGMGMHLLQKMGWKPGEGLGKEKTGSLEPLLLEVKLDKKGLVANEEVKGKKPIKVQKNQATVKTLAGKHPVSLLGEYATKRKLGVPQYECCFECGPDHKKNFLFKVILNGIEYKPNIASSTKKQAKADAATVCLQQLGILLS